jgi:DNA-binding NtrC family response regulator
MVAVPYTSNPTKKYQLANLIGRSPAFLRVLSLINKLAACDATILMHGETGTGKELVARAIHYTSARSEYPFIPINCGAIADSLIESELFGAERGAFTDAKEARHGIIAQAAGGTLLLDELEVMSPKAQVVLLRFLEDREYRPVGGRIRHADVRIIAASNRDLSDMVNKGLFREDLFFRLNLVSLEMPALRERDNDVLLLAERFIARYEQAYQQPMRTLHPDTVAAFLRYCWPGNVRELENLIHRQFIVSDEPVIRLGINELVAVKDRRKADRSINQPAPDTFQAAKSRAIAQFEKSYLASLLNKTEGNVSLAAVLSGKERSALGKLMKKYGLARAKFKR